MSVSSAPVPGAESRPTVDLLAGGTVAFDRILRRIAQARRTIAIRSFEWRDDDTGQTVARALLAAAERGVAVTIFKDRLGGFYEHLAGAKQSFFHKQIDFSARWQLWGLMLFYGRWGSLRQRPSALAEALRDHARVKLVNEKRYDHAKLFVFDDDTIILGGMGIGDDFRDVNVDFMVELAGGDAVARLEDRHAGRVPFDPRRSFDFLLHTWEGRPRANASLAAQRLELIEGARTRLDDCHGLPGRHGRDGRPLPGRRARRRGDALDGRPRRRRRRSEPLYLRPAPSPDRRLTQPSADSSPHDGPRQGHRR